MLPGSAFPTDPILPARVPSWCYFYAKSVGWWASSRVRDEAHQSALNIHHFRLVGLEGWVEENARPTSHQAESSLSTVLVEKQHYINSKNDSCPM